MPSEAPDSTPPLKRHAALQPLSREHMGGLIHARNLVRAAEGDLALRRRAVEEFLHAWHAEMREHFLDEERLLLPLTNDPALAARLLSEHETLRSLAARCEASPNEIAADAATLRSLGTLLHDHIRWEERIYFETVQRDHPQALAALHPIAGEIEQQRPGSRARTRL